MRATWTPSHHPGDYAFVQRVRVRFAETDAMGVVHHAAYLPYLEEARVEYLRSRGHPYTELRDQGIEFAVVEVAVRYLRPLYFDDEVDVHLVLAGTTAATFQVGYLLGVGGQARATAVTVHAALTRAGRPTRLPAWVGLLAPAAGPPP
ncbi:MAG: acyl-CoA thioesterase [Acidimicrobiales bacterium]